MAMDLRMLIMFVGENLQDSGTPGATPGRAEPHCSASAGEVYHVTHHSCVGSVSGLLCLAGQARARYVCHPADPVVRLASKQHVARLAVASGLGASGGSQ